MDVKQPKNTVEELTKVLRQEIQIYRDYATSLGGDQDLMSKLNIDELEKSNKAKGTMLLKLKALDQARQNLVRKFAVANAMPEDQIKISDICEKVGAKEAEVLRGLRDELQMLIAQMKEVQHSTAALANASLGWINSSMATLHRMLSPTGTYNGQGKVDRDAHFTGRVVEKQV